MSKKFNIHDWQDKQRLAEMMSNTCPSCGKTVGEESTIVNLETHHYLIARCCKEWILIKNEEIKQEEWI